MKYQRITDKSFNVTTNDLALSDNYIIAVLSRLHDLENEIESGELISTKEVGDTEIEFFVKHNEIVRKNIAQDIFSWIYKNLVNLNLITGNVEINLSALNNFAKTYGVDVFDIFKQGEKQ